MLLENEDGNLTPPVVETPTQETQEDTPTEGGQKPVEDGQPKPEPTDEKPKTFTQEQVNKIMRSRIERDRLSFLKRYGVEDRDGLDSLIGKAQAYDIMKERYEARGTEIAELKEKLAFMTNNINPDREDDIRAYFKGKGLEFNEESLVNELETHPEWRNVVQVDDKPKTTIEVLGVEHRDRNIPETDAEKRRRIFGV
jgi:hypothetical protein